MSELRRYNQKIYSDEFVIDLIGWIRGGKPELLPGMDPLLSLTAKERILFFNSTLTTDGKVRINSRIIVPQSQVQEKILEEYNRSFCGRDKLYNLISQKYIGITKNDVGQFLKNHEGHQITTANRRMKGKIKPLIPRGLNTIWAIDLADMRSISHQNSGKKWIIVCTDYYSKYLWTRSLPNKTPSSTRTAMISIFNSAGVQPKGILSDNGKEFEGIFKTFLSSRGVKRWTTKPHSPQSNGLAESMVRLVKTRLQRYFVTNRTKRYINILPIIVESYNNQVHSVTKKSPIFLQSSPTDPTVIDRISRTAKARMSKWALKDDLLVGDSVRINKFTRSSVRKKRLTTKGIGINYSTTIFTISKVRKSHNPTTPILYQVEGFSTLYSRDQLLKIDRDSLIRRAPPTTVTTTPSTFLPPPTSLSERSTTPRRTRIIPSRLNL